MRLCARLICSETSTRRVAGPISVRSSELTQRWRRQVGCRLRLGEERGSRQLALVAYQVRGSFADGLVPLDCLRFFSVFDDETPDDRLATRLMGFRGHLTSLGVQFGGVTGSLIDKDLRLPPVRGGNGRRLDSADASLVEAAFGWERHLERCARHPHYPRRATLRFPEWWCVVKEPTDDLSTRDFRGKRLVELGQAIGRGLIVEAVFADLQHLPKRQVVTCRDPERLLCGTIGLTAFDLYHSRFRRTSDAFRS